MAIKIDRMDTTVEVTPPTRQSPSAPQRPGTSVDTGASLREAVGQVLAEELDQFIRNRGMSR